MTGPGNWCFRCGKSDTEPSGPGCGNPDWHSQPNPTESPEPPPSKSDARALEPTPPWWVDVDRDGLIAEHERLLAQERQRSETAEEA